VQAEFSWQRFDNASIEAFSRACDYHGPDDIDLRLQWLSQRWRIPTREFIVQARSAIDYVWLRRHPQVARSLVESFLRQGLGPRERPQTDEECLRFLWHCSGSRTAQNHYLESVVRFGSHDGASGAPLHSVLGQAVPSFALVSPSQQPIDNRQPYPYQRQAWERLTTQFRSSLATGIFEGLLVMPTGSGKTFTAARWLTEHALNDNRRVVWIAHRYELLEQAALAFHSCAGFARDREHLQTRIVSGIHCATSAIGPADDVLFCSVASLTRRQDIALQLMNDPRTFLVIDEAHHAVSKSYRRLIDLLKAQPRHCLLGLTATPTRTLVGERPILSRIFGGRILFELHARELIEQRFLARPIPVQVRTGAAVELVATAEDYQHVGRFAELSETWLNRIAHITSRNEEITRHYLANRMKYGKTLIFAINVAHAVLLCERLAEAGVTADYVASYRPTGDPIDQRSVIERFKRADSGLDVLVNVMILTEGVDIPKVQTVFLTRPTRSEILIRQMVGRALRGPAAGGTELAYLVSFEDDWQELEEWENPLDLVDDLLPTVPLSPAAAGQATDGRLADVIPWELIRTTANEMRRLSRLGDVEAFEAVPFGWYLLDYEADGEMVQQLVPVYEHQMTCWNEFLSDAKARKWELSHSEALFLDYFGDCDLPRPSRHFVAAVLDYIQATGSSPVVEQFKVRSRVDPREIASGIWEAQLSQSETARIIRQRYDEPLAKAIYATKQDFADAVKRALQALEEPDTCRQPRLAQVVFEPWSDQFLRPGPHHDLFLLWTEMLVHARSLVSVPGTVAVQVEWTQRILTGWYAKAYWGEGHQPAGESIRVNRLLDSPDVAADTLRFLLWHEFLHLHLRQGHTPAFRALERKWPNVLAADRELDTLGERFDIHWW
jgi:superfamily II DNA or RNA helicase